MKSYDERTHDVLEKLNNYQKNGEKRGKIAAKLTDKRFVARFAAAAAAVLLLVAINLTLFIPYPVGRDISAYKGSEYYPLISVVNRVTYRKPKYKNNFEKLTSELKDMFDFGFKGNDLASPDTSSGDMQPSYIETTENQVQGIIEGDLLKRSSLYSYYLAPTGYNSFTLSVCSAGDGTLQDIGRLDYTLADILTYGNRTKTEMYLTQDCSSVIVIIPCYYMDRDTELTQLLKIDVTNPDNPVEKESVFISGEYLSSRLVGDSLLVFTSLTVGTNPDFSKEYNYLPQTGSSPDAMQSLPLGDIIFDENAESSAYTVVCDTAVSDLTIKDHYAFLSYSQQSYVSENSVYLTRTYAKDAIFSPAVTFVTGGFPRNVFKYDYGKADSGDSRQFGLESGVYKKNFRFTDITQMQYGADGLKIIGTATVEGEVLNQFCMDERDGVFKVVVTSYVAELVIDNEVQKFTESVYTSASLYCLDAKKLSLISSLVNFAPKNERVYSARFDGTDVYVCTAVELASSITDPVFKIDTSDLENITSTDTGTIPGYSFHLVPFRSNLLLGIGTDEDRSLKIELYRQDGDKLVSVQKLNFEYRFADDRKAYFVDAKRGLVGFAAYDVETGNSAYVLLDFDGEKLGVANKTPLYIGREYDYTRAFYDDGYIYAFNGTDRAVLSCNGAAD